ncbi:hypothetical protein, partial [Klebsiella pneumoniae]|uniref:hypothetical protein n=1 Tax=Klebsiella pneumoniae TaxID=573 RepID=UPI0039688564
MHVIISQTEGILPSLSEFHYCRENDWGIGGNNINYFVELCPDINVSRTTVRKKLMDNPALQRAVEIQSEMLQLIQFQRWNLGDYVVTPAELYADLK